MAPADQTTSRHVEKTSPRSVPGSPGSTIAVRDVLRVLGEVGEPTRSSALASFRSSGGDVDRWQRRDREAMAAAIARAEDALEMQLHGRWTSARAALRDVRRRLELA